MNILKVLGRIVPSGKVTRAMTFVAAFVVKTFGLAILDIGYSGLDFLYVQAVFFSFLLALDITPQFLKVDPQNPRISS